MKWHTPKGPAMARGRVLVVEDEADIADGIRQYLEREGYEVAVAGTGPAALEAVGKSPPEVMVLDVMLPGMDGFEVCREIRKTRNLPILMLSARGDDVDKILGLEMGADDYLTKPFNPRELVARVRAMFRRLRMAPSPADEEVLVRGNLRVDVKRQEVAVEGHPVRLTPLEFSLLRTLAAHNGQVMTRQDLLDRVWGADYYGDERVVDTHVRHLRTKLQKHAPQRQFVLSVWGVGYKFE